MRFKEAMEDLEKYAEMYKLDITDSEWEHVRKNILEMSRSTSPEIFHIYAMTFKDWLHGRKSYRDYVQDINKFIDDGYAKGV